MCCSSLTALLTETRLFQTGSIPLPASRELHFVALCEHLHQNLFWACSVHQSRRELTALLLAQVPQACLIALGILELASRECHQIRSFNLRKGFSELQRTQFGQAQDPLYPGRPRVLKAQAPRAGFALEPGVAATTGKEVAKCGVLIPQALREASGGHLREPLVSGGTLPLREPARDVISREREAALAEPAVSAEPAIEQAALCAVRIGANSEASRDVPHA